ncbi:hypothetical protein D9V30_05185 [Mycetocola reblochoni]|uniref:Recombinase A n=1 Tax=Mycetocola reblochoni TaxID=331618 RepID=A0A3L6ZR45_9MICO|nr:AAA family ATPase [Mycetocola reblochoni]RLP70061.1 hypothetical protein D9V30_05185 [Mycetocola reblochoni]
MTLTEPATIHSYTPKLYADVAQLIAAGPITPPAPDIGLRRDGFGLFYREQVNSLIGDPESGKTWLALVAAAERLFLNDSVLFIDLDHNGAQGVVSRLQAMGVKGEVLSNPQLFRFSEPEDAVEIDGVVKDAKTWRPSLVIIDSLGELLPVYGASSNSADDFTRVHSRAIKPFATAGAAVVLIDHLAKGTDSRNYGATGTAAKKRAIGGTMLRVNCTEPFTPGTGGRAEIILAKDRHGGLRQVCPPGKEPLAAKFRLIDTNGALDWRIEAPDPGEMPTTPASGKTTATLEDDVASLEALDVAPRSKADVTGRMGWGNDRAMVALREWRTRNAITPPVSPA